MRRTLLFLALAAGLVLAAGTADAARVPGSKAPSDPSSGARTDIFMPYLTSGSSTMMGNGVAPIIVHKPGLGTKDDAVTKPVYNLIYYGAKKAPNSDIMGAIPREPNKLRPNR